MKNLRKNNEKRIKDKEKKEMGDPELLVYYCFNMRSQETVGYNN